MFGEHLRQVRTEKGWSLYDVERKTGIGFSLLSKYEREERTPSRKRLEILADFYGVSIDWLLGRTDQRKNIYITTDQVAEESAKYGLPDDDSRVLEIAKQLRERNLPDDVLDNLLALAKYLAGQERDHPAKPGVAVKHNGNHRK